jgi:RNA polymerase sigma-B factor
MKSKLEPEYEPLYAAWTARPDKQTTGALLRTVEPVISNALRSYGGGPASPTLRSQARQLAVQSFDNYDPQRGSLRSHLLSRLQRIHRVAGQERQIIRVPEQVSLDQMHTDAATTNLQEKLGRPPSDSELADHTGISLRRLGYIRQGRRPIAEGTISRTNVEGGGYDPATQAINVNNDTWLEFIYDELPPTNQFIMERAFGLHGNTRMSATAIAKALKITPGAVSHRMQQIQRQLDELEDLGAYNS